MHLASNTILQGHEQATGGPFPMAFKSDISKNRMKTFTSDMYFKNILQQNKSEIRRNVWNAVYDRKIDI